MLTFQRAALCAAAFASAPAVAQHSGHDHGAAPPSPATAQNTDHNHAGHAATQPPAASAPLDHGNMDHGSMDHGAAAGHQMPGALGRYPMGREASGTAWQPDNSVHGGVHASVGNWMLMGHLHLNGVFDYQEGPRGDDKVFVAGMAMGMARREFDGGAALQFRAMLSPDPLMGKDGYPLLLASGETADGVRPLIDRQHPHDLFMELSASYSVPVGERASVFIYGGLPGEPAFGPPAFMHRRSILDSPEAPISHHWLDSTHITFGVITVGVIYDRVKVEASRFRGREPDEHRYNIETGPLDSTAVRLSWNPTAALSLQASWADIKSPEQLEPDEDQIRWSASAIYTRAIGDDGWWSTTAAWGRRSSDDHDLDAWVLESAVGLGAWTLFGRAEATENNELLFDPEHGHGHGPAFDVGKASVGAIRDFPIADQVKVGIGGLVSVNFVPDGLKALYGGSTPLGAMGFVRLKVE